MKLVTDILIVLVGVGSLIFGVQQLFRFLRFTTPDGLPDMWGGVSHLLIAVLAIAVAIVCVALFFVRHPRKEEEIHITE